MTTTRIEFYRDLLNRLAKRADALTFCNRMVYSQERARLIAGLQGEYDAWLGLAVLRFPGAF